MITRLALCLMTFAVLLFSACTEKNESIPDKTQVEPVRTISVDIRQEILPQLIFMSLAAVFLAAFGSEIVEFLRSALSRIFKLSVNTQVFLANSGFLLICGLILFIGLSRWDFLNNIPLFILLTGACQPFRSYIQALQDEDASQCRMYLGKVKSLLFLCVVIMIIYELLSPAGFMGVGISK